VQRLRLVASETEPGALASLQQGAVPSAAHAPRSTRLHDRSATPDERRGAEAAYTASLPTVCLLLESLRRRSGLLPEDSEEFVAWAHEHLIRDDYAVVRVAGERFHEIGYLRVMLSRLLIDFRNHIWGRWRPSAVAQRLGVVAIQLDQLISRDGMAVQEAIQVMRSRNPAHSEPELRALISELPRRVRDREVDVSNASNVPADESPSQRLESAELWMKLDTALRRAFAQLSLEDRVIARMRFQDGATIPEIAQMLDLEPKPLYRRLEAILKQLRVSLLQDGVRPQDVREVIDLHLDGAAS
jgi:RNA polymerase sigma factor (sigma-70 family)